MSSKKDNAKELENDAFMMDKYSRQVGEYGVEAMAKLTQMKVLIIGLKGVGIEAAKNLILAGVGQVTLFDDETVVVSDLGTNFYMTEGDVRKKTCADASLDSLKSLNPLVTVNKHTGQLVNKDLRKFDVVLDCGLTMEQAKLCNKEIRKNLSHKKTIFIRCHVHGLMGFSFVDFGEEFKVLDKTGEQEVQRIIDSIDVTTAESKGIIVVHLVPAPDGQRHGIEFDDHHGFIKFDEVRGELGDILNKAEKPFEVKRNTRITSDEREVYDPYSLQVVLPKKMRLPEYEKETAGLMLQSRKPVVMKFKPLAEMVDNPVHPDEGMLMFTDGAKFGRADQLHLALQGLWEYEKEHHSLPVANDEAAVSWIVEKVKEINAKNKDNADALSVVELDEEVVADVARYAECRFQPFCTFFGGVIAQEIVKFTGKYTPLRQWLHLDCFEVLPHKFAKEDATPVDPADKMPLGSRYDDLIKIIGKTRHQELMRSTTFMVGCGALGCELLKNFALLGVACDPEKTGQIIVTDNDNIEISNLSRQFLFRENNVGQSKSLAASESVLAMNPDINVNAKELLVNPDSENVFNSDFWGKLNFVTNALDNVKARTYVDSQCVFYEKPLLESGTLGTKCNSQVILPHMTASYTDGPIDEPDGIAMCTLRNFPSTIEHCVEWARGKFTDLFEADSQKAVKFQKDPAQFLTELRSKTVDLGANQKVLSALAIELPSLRVVHKMVMLLKNNEATYESCVREAYDTFHSFYRDVIHSLTRAHPQDDLDSEGHRFWSGTKRFPQVATFDANDDSHLGFIISMANILAANLGIAANAVKMDTSGKKTVREIVGTFTTPPLKLEAVDLSEDTEEDKRKKAAEAAAEGNTKDDLIVEFEKLLAELEEVKADPNVAKARLEAASFEKDDDSNFHIDFISAASNLRAWNYRMNEISRHKAKMIAGKIIPALATTTAAVTGLVMVELLKVMQLKDGKTLDAFKDTSNNLGLNAYFFSTPGEPEKAKNYYDQIEMAEVTCLPVGFTKWDKVLITGGDMTLKEFLEAFKGYSKEKFDKNLRLTYLVHKLGNDPAFTSLQGSRILYEEEADGDRAKEYEENLSVNLKDLVAAKYGEHVLENGQIRLDITAVDEDDTIFKLPQLVYQYR